MLHNKQNSHMPQGERRRFIGIQIFDTMDPCHRGDVNGGCVVVGKPHPSHPFTKLHPTVYKTARAVQKKTYDI